MTIGVFNLHDGAEADPKIQQLVDWCYTFLGSPNNALGRSNGICPFIKSALDKGLVSYSLVNNWEDRHLTWVNRAIMQRFWFWKNYTQSLPTESQNLSAHIVIFEPISSKKVGKYEILQSSKMSLKPELLALGTSIGAIYPDSLGMSIDNENVIVADGPLPCIALRSVVGFDQKFVLNEPELKIKLDRVLKSK